MLGVLSRSAQKTRHTGAGRARFILERNKILANDSACSRPSASVPLTINDDLAVSAV